MAVLLVLCAAVASLAAGLLAAAVWMWVNRLRTSAPGPPTVPLLGNALQCFKQPVLLDRMKELHNRYGDIFRFYVGSKLVIVITQPEDMQKVLAEPKQPKHDLYFTNAFRILAGNGLLTNNGETWKKHRKALEPAFHIGVLDKYVESFNNGARFLCDKLASSAGKEVEIYQILILCTLRIVTDTFFGTDMDRLEPDEDKQIEISNMIISFMKAVSVMLFRPWQNINWINRMTPEGRELRRLSEFCRKKMDKLLVLAKDTTSPNARGTSPLMNFLLGKIPGNPMTYDEIRDEALTLLVTGTETVAGSLSFTLSLLALYPEWQDIAQREVDKVLGKQDDCLASITAGELSQMTAIDAIIKESLRLYPLLPILPTSASEDIPLADGRHVAPSGTCVCAAFFLMHRHPQLFQDPEEFDPSRFLPGGSATSRKNYSYLPFSIGSRQCIGSRYANLEMRILLTMVLHKFHIIPGSSRKEMEDILMSITSHPITGFRVTFVPRDNHLSNFHVNNDF